MTFLFIILQVSVGVLDKGLKLRPATLLPVMVWTDASAMDIVQEAEKRQHTYNNIDLRDPVLTLQSGKRLNTIPGWCNAAYFLSRQVTLGVSCGHLSIYKYCLINHHNLSTSLHVKCVRKIISHVPGTDEPFRLDLFKVDIGKPYCKIKLYLCESDISLGKHNIVNPNIDLTIKFVLCLGRIF